MKKIGQYLKAENLEQVVIFFGNGLIDLFGMDVMDSLKRGRNHGIGVQRVGYSGY